MRPYRRRATGSAGPSPEGGDEERRPNTDLLPLLVVFWGVSVVRAVVALVRGQALGADGALAVVGLVAVPYLSRDAVRWWIRRCRKRFRA